MAHSEFPRNDNMGSRRTQRASESATDPREKNIEKVVTGPVVQKKATWTRRLTQHFGGGSRSVGEYLVLDIAAPALKDLISDLVSTAVDTTLYPDDRGGRRTRSSRHGDRRHTNYNAISTGPPRSRGREEVRDSRAPRARVRDSSTFDDVILADRVQATLVLERMYFILEEYDAVSVADLNALLGITGTFTDENYGWLDLANTHIRKVREGYLVDLPRPEYIA